MAPTISDQYDAIGRAKLAERIDVFVGLWQPIKFSMLGYPMKSPNDRDKVIGKLPDLGEELSFANFAYFAQAVREVYSPGVEYALISDGYIFSDIMQTSDATVQAYAERNKAMTRAARLPVMWYDMLDFYPSHLGLPAIREKVMADFGIPAAELERRILFDPDVNTLYRGMLFFMEGDLAIREFPSRNQLHKQAKIVAREMMFRNEAYSKLIQTNFTDHIRLSMHQSVNNGTKYSFQLIPSPLAKHSPWHSAVLKRKDGLIQTIHKSDALAAGHELVNVNGQPFYFQER